MTDAQPEGRAIHRLNEQELEFGGLRFDVYFNAARGATIRVSGQVDGDWNELLRFDDFIDSPHYHVPASDPNQIMYDRANGDPLEWYLAQIGGNLPALLVEGGYADIVPAVDMAAVSANMDQLRSAMHDCVPDGFSRVPGVGLQRTETPASP